MNIVRQICEDNGIKLIVKSKSMVSEEVELNHELEPFGIQVVETDLGEWIVQMGHERPSHIVGPALHLGRQQVGELLNKVLDKPVSLEDIPEQVRTIRDEIRPAFFEAGAGMTGANALIAESGTVMMVTNEGNGRLSGSIPPVHIVLAGIEKLVPTYDDAMTQLRLLARSATGQRMTVYTTFMTGPTHGHEMHIVLVDNGRRMMRSMPEFVDALHCIRCGACSNVCPPYGEVSGHVFGHIYSVRLGLVVSGVPSWTRIDRQSAIALPLLQRLRDGLPGQHSTAATDSRCAQDGGRSQRHESQKGGGARGLFAPLGRRRGHRGSAGAFPGRSRARG